MWSFLSLNRRIPIYRAHNTIVLIIGTHKKRVPLTFEKPPLVCSVAYLSIVGLLGSFTFFNVNVVGVI